MLQPDASRGNGSNASSADFVLYVEGPGDRGILREWSYRLLPRMGRTLVDATVILGGRQPARAVEHFTEERRARPGLRALCILDRDDDDGPAPGDHDNLGFFTWSRRHIESYLLVPDAVRRALGGGEGPKLDRAFRDHFPAPGDEHALRALDAKRLLGRKGPIARALGRPLPLTRVARATREPELHVDVHDLFTRIGRELGAVEPTQHRR
jgi:hypothetical protein